jgi:hypothetical protein
VLVCVKSRAPSVSEIARVGSQSPGAENPHSSPFSRDFF